MWDWDEVKRAANLAKHGVDFAVIDNFDWLTADVWVDGRFDYGEERKSGLGLIAGRLFAVAYTERGLDNRIISLRKANKRERRLWSSSAK